MTGWQFWIRAARDLAILAACVFVLVRMIAEDLEQRRYRRGRSGK
jgi:hypothetical protein